MEVRNLETSASKVFIKRCFTIYNGGLFTDTYSVKLAWLSTTKKMKTETHISGLEGSKKEIHINFSWRNGDELLVLAPKIERGRKELKKWGFRVEFQLIETENLRKSNIDDFGNARVARIDLGIQKMKQAFQERLESMYMYEVLLILLASHFA